MKRNISPVIISLVVIGASMGVYVFLPRASQTTSVVGHAVLAEISKEELIRSSTVALIARVSSVRSGKYPSKIREGEEDIVSTVTLEVEKYLYNPENITSQTLAVQTLGGSVSGTKMIVEGSPSFKAGDRVLVFLTRDSLGAFTVNGWTQGKYTVSVNGEIGVGDEELAHLHKMFSGSRFVSDIENEIKSVAVLPPSGGVVTPTEVTLSSKNGNVEAQAVLDAAVVK